MQKKKHLKLVEVDLSKGKKGKKKKKRKKPDRNKKIEEIPIKKERNIIL